MFLTGITEGVWIPFFAIVSFTITIVHAFLWNKLWVFRDTGGNTKKQLASFMVVAIAGAIIATSLIHILINVVGAPWGISNLLWANIVMVGLIPVMFTLNFLGIKLLVFRRVKI
jgi:putative flippase GtrA